MADYTLSVKISADVKDFASSLSSVQSSLEATSKKWESLSASLGKIGGTLTKSITVPVVAAATASIKNFSEVDKTMRLVEKTMGDTAWASGDLEKAMKSAASNSVFGMNDAANAALNFARQGFNAADASKMLTPAMSLAAGTATDLAVVSGGLGNAMKVFADQGLEAGNAADILAKAQGQANTTVQDLLDSMTVAGPVVDSVGWSMKDLAVITDVFGDAGISGSEGATALKTGLARLASPADDATAVMKRLGIEIFNTDGTMKSFTSVQKQLHTAFAGLTQEEQLQAAATLFGKNQMAKWMTLIKAAPETVDKYSSALDNCTGSAEEMANALLSGPGGAIEKLKSSLDVLSYTLGDIVGNNIQPFIEDITEIVDKFNNLDKGTQEATLKMVAFAAAIGPAFLALSKGVGIIASVEKGMGTLVGGVSKTAESVATNFDSLRNGFSRVGDAASGLGSKWGSVFSSVSGQVSTFTSGVSSQFSTFTSGVSSKFSSLTSDVSSKVSGMVESLATPDRIDAVTSKFSAFSDTIKSKASAIASSISGTLGNVGAKVSQFGGGIIGNVGAALSQTATVVTEGLNTIMSTSQVVMSALLKTIAPATIVALLLVGLGVAYEQFGAQIDQFTQTAVEKGPAIIQGLVDGIVSKIPTLIEEGSHVLQSFLSVITANAPTVVAGGVQIIASLVNGLAQQLPTLIPAAVQAIAVIVSTLIQNIPQLLVAGMNILMGLAQGIVNSIPTLIATATQAITGFLGELTNHLPDMVNMAVSIITTLVNGLVNNLPLIIQSGLQIIISLGQAILNNLPTIIEGGIQVIVALASGLIQAIPILLASLPQIFTSIIDAFASVDWIGIGKTIITSIGEGILSLADTLFDSIGNICDWIKGKFTGTSEEVSDKSDEINESVSDMASKTQQSVSTSFSNIESTTNTSWSNIYSTIDSKTNVATGAVQDMATSTQNSVDTAFGNMDSTTTSDFSSMLNTVSSNSGKIGDTLSGLQSDVGDTTSNISGKYDTLATNIGKSTTSMSNSTNTGLSGMNTATLKQTTAMASQLEKSFTSMSASIDKSMTSIVNTVSKKISTMSTSVQDTFSSAIRTVKSSVSSIQSAVNRVSFNMGQYIRLPHFYMYGNFNAKSGSVPHVGVDWYAKAMDKGMILSNPTIFGAMNGKLLGAGERGAEVVVGANSLERMINRAVGNGGGGQVTNNITVVANPGQDTKDIADKVAEVIFDRVRREAYV
jgi:TP901 family phage tail tape measure protein